MKKILQSSCWLAAILTAGILYILYLQGLVADHVYLTGDSGLKTLLTQELAAGRFDFAVHFPDPLWVKVLWIEDMLPYGPPFIYQFNELHYITFDFTLSLLSAPFYALLGYRGLLVIPLLSVVATWLAFAWLCRKLGLSQAAGAAGLAALIFSTHLTVYGVLIWEHSLSVALAFIGLALLIAASGPQAHKSFPRAAAWAGFLCGVAAWVRSEQILVVLLVDLLCAWAVLRAWRPQLPARWLQSPALMQFWQTGGLPPWSARWAWVYPLSSLLATLVYGICNTFIYGNPLGIHLIQMVEQRTSVRTFIFDALGNLRLMTVGQAALFAYAPLVIFPMLSLLLAWLPAGRNGARPTPTERGARRFPAPGQQALWLAMALFFILVTAILVPEGGGGKQWGPRFYLVLAPLAALLAAWQLDELLRRPRPAARWLGAALMLALAAAGAVQNALGGPVFVRRETAELQPAVTMLREGQPPVVAIANPYIAQVFQPSLNRDTIFFQVLTENHLARLAEAISRAGLDGFTYICYAEDCKVFDRVSGERMITREQDDYRLTLTSDALYNKYRILSVQVRPDD